VFCCLIGFGRSLNEIRIGANAGVEAPYELKLRKRLLAFSEVVIETAPQLFCIAYFVDYGYYTQTAPFSTATTEDTVFFWIAQSTFACSILHMGIVGMWHIKNNFGPVDFLDKYHWEARFCMFIQIIGLICVRLISIVAFTMQFYSYVLIDIFVSFLFSLIIVSRITDPEDDNRGNTIILHCLMNVYVTAPITRREPDQIMPLFRRFESLGLILLVIFIEPLSGRPNVEATHVLIFLVCLLASELGEIGHRALTLKPVKAGNLLDGDELAVVQG